MKEQRAPARIPLIRAVRERRRRRHRARRRSIGFHQPHLLARSPIHSPQPNRPPLTAWRPCRDSVIGIRRIRSQDHVHLIRIEVGNINCDRRLIARHREIGEDQFAAVGRPRAGQAHRRLQQNFIRRLHIHGVDRSILSIKERQPFSIGRPQRVVTQHLRIFKERRGLSARRIRRPHARRAVRCVGRNAGRFAAVGNARSVRRPRGDSAAICIAVDQNFLRLTVARHRPQICAALVVDHRIQNFFAIRRDGKIVDSPIRLRQLLHRAAIHRRAPQLTIIIRRRDVSDHRLAHRELPTRIALHLLSALALRPRAQRRRITRAHFQRLIGDKPNTIPLPFKFSLNGWIDLKR